MNYRGFITVILIFAFLFTSCGPQNSYNSPRENTDNNHSSINEANLLKVFSERLSPTLPEFTFKLYGTKDDVFSYINKITIYVENSEMKLSQEIKIEDSMGPNSLDRLGVYIEDVNFDGYKDIMIQGAGGAGPNIPYHFWLWNKDSYKFIFSEELDGLISVQINRNDKIIFSSNTSSAGSYYIESYYKFISNKFTLVKQIERIADVSTSSFNYTVRELINNKMKIVKVYSEPYEE
jgi:hypothetical protein